MNYNQKYNSMINAFYDIYKEVYVTNSYIAFIY